jgi:hypothetical protein
MSDNNIVAIIEELRQLHIRELQVLANLEATIINNQQIQNRTTLPYRRWNRRSPV